MKKAFLWHFRFPGMTYCNDLQFREPVTEAEARRELREKGRNVKRLPNGTEFWT